jgi:hypothetical protein
MFEREISVCPPLQKQNTPTKDRIKEDYFAQTAITEHLILK